MGCTFKSPKNYIGSIILIDSYLFSTCLTLLLFCSPMALDCLIMYPF